MHNSAGTRTRSRSGRKEQMAGSRQQFLAREDFDDGLERRTGRDPFADPDGGEDPCEGAKERLAHFVDTGETL